jgi:hypothetical protein
MSYNKVNLLLKNSDIYIPEYTRIWGDYENQAPTYIKNINFIDWENFSDKIKNKDLNFYRSLVSNLISGDIYVLKKAVSKPHIKIIKEEFAAFAKNNVSKHYKIVNNCPDFFRYADLESAKKYSFYRCNTLFYLYRWNNSELFKIADLTWDTLKMASGLKKEAFKKLIPSNGLVDRLHIHLYPPNMGEQENHQDPFIIQKIVMGHALSKRGVDYESGGIYFINKKQEEVDVDSLLDEGDCYICYPSLVHGVKKIKQLPSPVSNAVEFSGRWFMGFYTVWSDENVIRKTSNPWSNNQN